MSEPGSDQFAGSQTRGVAEVQHESPTKLLAELKALEVDILKGLAELEEVLR